MNHISITGNLTRDPETFSPQGSENTCIKFSIANNDESKKDGDNYEDVPSYFDVKYWTKNVQYWIQKLTKGAPVTVQGRMKQERWTDKENNNHSRIVILAEVGYNQGFAIVVHDRVKSENQSQSQEQSQSGSGAFDFEDDIPF